MNKNKKLLPIGSYTGKCAQKNKEFHKELMLKNKSFCPIAFREIYVDNAGRHRLCCHAHFDPKFSKFSEEKTLPFDYFMSNEMEEIRWIQEQHTNAMVKETFLTKRHLKKMLDRKVCLYF